MSEFARLEEKLAKLRQRERAPGEGRRLSGADGAARLAALVTEIDETILPRRLSFDLGGGAALHLAVANRRLQALLSPAPDGLPDGLADRPLSDDSDPAIGQLGAALSGLLEAVGPVAVSSARPGRAFGSDIGIPAARLARAWGAAGTPRAREPGDILNGFLDGLGPDAIAWLKIEGEAVTDQGGDAASVADLGDKAAVFLDGYFGKFDTVFPEPAQACGTLVAPGKDGSAGLFFVEIGEVSAIILAPPGKIFGLATRWQGLVAT